jgi:hypothetical protein
MTKNVASFAKISVGELIQALELLGFGFLNPHLNNIAGWNEHGEEITLLSESEAREFLIEGRGMTVWRGRETDLFVSVVHGIPRISFGGHTEQEEIEFVKEFSKAKLAFSVDHEDEAHG